MVHATAYRSGFVVRRALVAIRHILKAHDLEAVVRGHSCWGHNCETSRATVSTRRALASWTISPKEVLEPLTPQIDCTQRFARVAIFPKPHSRRSAVTSVRPSTSAVAAKKRSAGSGCSSGNSWAATTISCVNGASRMCIVAVATQSRIVPSKCIRRLACNSSASQVLTGDNHSSFWPSLSSCCTRRESRLG